MRYRVTWARRSDLRNDLDTQLSRGGIFVNVAPPDGVQYGHRLGLELVTPDGAAHRTDGAVLAAVPGSGIALSVSPDVVSALRAALDRCGEDAPGAQGVRHELARDDAPPVAAAPHAASAVHPSAPTPLKVPLDAANWDALSPADKMRLAQHGDRDERAAALRDKNRSLHPHVLKNGRISIEEVVAIARNPQCAPDMLRLISERVDWAGRAQIAEALARNPKTPNDIAVRMLANCSTEALRQMAKGTGAPPHVIQAARRRVIG